jgi:uncharacterized RDD family membrane protein YckC
VFCANCGQPLSPGAVYCANCGTPASTAPVSTAPVNTAPVNTASTATSTGLTPYPVAAAHRESLLNQVSPYAHWGRRILSFIIDSLFVGVPATAALIAWAVTNSSKISSLFSSGTSQGSVTCISNGFHSITCTSPAGIHTLNFPILLLLGIGALQILWYLYVIFAISGKHAATPGMRVMHMRVANPVTFTHISPARALLRTFIYAVLASVNLLVRPLSILLLVDLLWPLWDSRRQTLHDKFSKTVVLDLRYGDPLDALTLPTSPTPL